VNPDPATGESAVADVLAHGETDADRTHHPAERPDGIPEVLRRISAEVARFRVGTCSPPAWWAQCTGDRITLDALVRSAVVNPAALARIASFASRHEEGPAAIRVPAMARDDVDAEIEGFRLFGCLLHLTGHPVSARFWWRLAAGADDRLSAFCVYLQHLQCGELREAEWWLQEASRPDTDADVTPPAPALPDMPDYFRAVPAMLGTCDGRPAVQPGAALAEEVDRLVVSTDPQDPADSIAGIAGRPGPASRPA
jgi:hypothetical protein